MKRPDPAKDPAATRPTPARPPGAPAGVRGIGRPSDREGDRDGDRDGNGDGAPDGADAGAIRAGAAASARLSAVVLHDAEPTLALVRSLLDAAGFDVLCTASALQLAVADGIERARLIVLGATAVDDRNVEVVSILRRRAPDAWILVLHPLALRERASHALVLGADGTLVEPFYPQELGAHAARARERTRRVADAAPEAPGERPPPPPSSSPSSPSDASEPAPVPRDADPATASRLAERLAGGVAQSLLATLDAVDRRLGAPDAAGDVDVSALRAELRGVSGIAEGLRRFAGHDGISLRPIDVADLVTGVFMSRDVGAAGAEIGVRIGESRVEVLADPELLRVALESVRNRAVRVTPPEGRISVRTRSRVEAGRRMVEISVTDGGPALDPERRAHLFEPFTEDPAAAAAAGLEFAGVAGIVRAHGGTVAALAAGAIGTIVLLRLPVSGAAD